MFCDEVCAGAIYAGSRRTSGRVVSVVLNRFTLGVILVFTDSSKLVDQ